MFVQTLLLTLGITIATFLLMFCAKLVTDKKFPNLQINAHGLRNIYIYIAIFLIVIELSKQFFLSLYWHDTRLFNYIPAHISSLPMYLFAILVFANPNSKFYKIINNFLIITLFIITVSFALAQTTPLLCAEEFAKQEIYLVFHSYIWHTSIVVMYAFFAIFRPIRMQSGVNTLTVMTIIAVNFIIFWFCEVASAANIPYVLFVIYNQNLGFIYDLVGQSQLWYNLVAFILVLIVYVGFYYLYCYCQQLFEKNLQGKANKKYSRT
ncbi:MAG: hypothetical protein LBC33_03165 [Mycoplasmataceae bacterium]|jgi:hypothetical protein|nr:hypothetical protein [Mycoplasmataceae bacterium]